MTLETVVLHQDLFGYGFYTHGGGGGGGEPFFHGFNSLDDEAFMNSSQWVSSSCSMVPSNVKECDTNSSTQETGIFTPGFSQAEPPVASSLTTSGRRKRQRTKSCIKNKEEIEHQRMTHITVERNRRKQMNDYLSILRSMMPPSYVQRGDQASIVGGAINFVKELEQLLQSLEGHKKVKKESDFSSLFTEFLSFPQYSTLSANNNNGDNDDDGGDKSMGKRESKMADVEVTMVENHANLKILIEKQPRQLLKMVTGLYSLCLSVLHINVTTVHHMVLYSFSVKVEDECELSTVNEISAAVYEMVGRVQEEAVSNTSL